MIRFYWFAYFLLFCSTSFGQQYSFLSYNTAEGLPQSQVTSIAQDKNGYLWVGTIGGLAKFNGKDFVSFSTDNGILNNRISFIGFIDDVLWIGHEGGVSKIENNKIQKWAFDQKNRTTSVSDIVKYKNRILIASNGGGLFEFQKNKLVAIKISGKVKNSTPEFELQSDGDMRIRDMMVFKDELLIATRSGILYTKDLKNFKHIKSFNQYSISGLEQIGEKVFATSFKNGLFEYSYTSKTTKKIEGIDTLLSLRGCNADSKGNLWISSSDGIFRMKNGRINLRLNQSNGLPLESIRSVFEDKNGNIWFGSEGKGLLRFPGEFFQYYNEKNGLSSELILNVNQDLNGNYWLGTLDKGLMLMDAKKNVKALSLESNNTIWSSVLDVDGFNWFGTGAGLVAMKNKTISKIYYFEDGLPGDKITSFFKVSANSFYVGGSDGVSLYKNGKFTFLNTNEYTTVRDFCKVNGKIYCATDRGLFVIQGNSMVPIGNLNQTIYSLASDNDNVLWIGTEEGLYRMQENKIVQIVFSKVPSSNFINFLEYYNEQLFIGTNNGLFVISNLNKSNREIINYGISEGVLNLETNINSSFIDKKGILWFGTASGLVSFSTATNNKLLIKPTIILRSILINYQEVDFKNYSEGLGLDGLPINLRLPYSKNNLTFDMDGISLSSHTDMKFQFWLVGQDETWSPLNANTTITFNGLSAGEYVLHARCIDSKGLISDEVVFKFTIKQAFYKTWWFIVLVLLTLSYLIVRIFQFRLKREREVNEKEKLEFKSKLLALEQKSLNASMNRHFIFNSLNSIQYFINTQDRLSANRFLTNFAKLIRKNLDSSDEGNMVALSQELERLDLYLSLEHMRFKDRFDYKINCPDSIDTESIIIPAMMLQPFIENSIIHGILPDESKKGLIVIDISLKGDILTIQIEDNGVGIENSMKNKMGYEGDHKSQGMDITTKRIDLLKRLSNKSFELIGPIQINDNNSLVKGTRVILKFQVDNLEN